MTKRNKNSLFSELADYVGDGIKDFGYDLNDKFNKRVSEPFKYGVRSARYFCEEKISNARADFQEAKWEAQEQGSLKGFKKYFKDKAERKANAPVEIDDGVYFMGGAEAKQKKAEKSQSADKDQPTQGRVIDAEYEEVGKTKASQAYRP